MALFSLASMQRSGYEKVMAPNFFVIDVRCAFREAA
jgi:hypothetical protein